MCVCVCGGGRGQRNSRTKCEGHAIKRLSVKQCVWWMGGGGGVGGGKETNVKRAIWNKSQCFLLHLIIFLFNFDQYNAKRAKTQ